MYGESQFEKPFMMHILSVAQTRQVKLAWAFSDDSDGQIESMCSLPFSIA
jgi:hypothetical protein